MTDKPKTYADDLTVAEIAEEFGYAETTVWRWTKHSKHPLPSRLVYNTRVIRRSDVVNRLKAVQEGRKQ